MTDDELVIRHVRLCECGRVADHDGICAPTRLAAAQRLDDERDAAAAELRRKRHNDRQAGFRAERLQRAAALTRPARLARLLARVTKLSAVPAGSLEPSRGSGHMSALLTLGDVQRPEDDSRWKHWLADIDRVMERGEDLVGEFEGHGIAPSRELTSEAKDAEIVAPYNAHLSAAEFSRQFPGFGSPSTVARKRRWFAGGWCTMNGLSPKHDCRCPTCKLASG